MIENITAVILAGGKSSRIGTDKALIEFNGQPLIKNIFSLLHKIFLDIIIISNNPEQYYFLTAKVYKDIHPNFGPLSGIHSGLSHSDTFNNFFISCDMPFVNKELIEFILSRNNDHDIILPNINSVVHSLCGIYKKSCLNISEDLLKTASGTINLNGKTKVRLFDLINKVKTDFIDPSKENFYNDDLFFNMNTIEDISYVKEKLSC